MKTPILALVAVLALTACEPPAGTAETPADGPGNGTVGVFVVDVDGRDVTCVRLTHSHGAGLSCDWESAE